MGTGLYIMALLNQETPIQLSGIRNVRGRKHKYNMALVRHFSASFHTIGSRPAKGTAAPGGAGTPG